MQNFFKIISGFLLFLILTTTANTKPIPPGSGEGDVPANILFLLDSSISMRHDIVGGVGVQGGVDWAVELDDGNIIAAENGKGIFKFLIADGKRDPTFAGDKRFSDEENCLGKETKVNKSFAGDISSNDVIWFTSTQNSGQVIAIDSNGTCLGVINKNSGGRTTIGEIGTGIAMTRHLEIREIDGEEILFVAGFTNILGGGKAPHMYVRNLSTNAEGKCSMSGGNSRKIGHILDDTSTRSMTISNDGEYIYFSRANEILAYELEEDGGLYCPKTDLSMRIQPHNGRIRDKDNSIIATIDKFHRPDAIRFSRDENNVIYLTSRQEHSIQKFQIDPTALTISVDATLGGVGDSNEGDPGSISAANVKLRHPGRANSTGNIAHNLHISSDRDSILVGDRNNFVQKFSKSKFTADDDKIDTAWQAQYFGDVLSRFEGAKKAIEAVVTDSSLTAGANFGLGHWNSGMYDKRGWPEQLWEYGGEYNCHFFGGCEYYTGWNGAYPEGTSNPCLGDYCLEVAVSATGKDKILEVLPSLQMEWGTDGDSFSQIAYDYFHDDPDTNVIDDTKPCKINYVIVISDGHIMNAAETFDRLHDLRIGPIENDDKDDVKTLLVGYGGTYDDPDAKPIFDRLARAGSCVDPGGWNDDVNHNTFEGLANKTDCEKAIGASTPNDLKVEIGAKIRQIIADRLSFSAPSITATLEEGGSIYQAQFDYEQRGEWKGKLLKKTITNGIVDHDNPEWDAGEVLAGDGSTGRNIWTAIDTAAGANYVGSWNNWKSENFNQINDLFKSTGNIVRDYHHSASTCKNAEGVEDGNIDDIKGLINFVRGVDYFDYDGGCDITEDRDSILADIYHSQLVEVGAPNANTTFTSNNHEAYWRSTQNYNSFKNSNQNRSSMIYAGSNGGMLHAFNSDDGTEEWAFIPPMVASSIPLLVNANYDGVFLSNKKAGGTNAIFGVDGSPVIHDVKIKGLNSSGTAYETSKSWRTLLFVGYGRGGPGFSVLDVTKPKLVEGEKNSEGDIVGAGQGPLHMFSIYNDTYNQQIIRVDHNGKVTRQNYSRFILNINDSSEAEQASDNYQAAREADELLGDQRFDNRLAIQDCKNDTDFDPDTFRDNGTTSCYTGTTFHFITSLPSGSTDSEGNIKAGVLNVSERKSGAWVPISGVSGKMVGGELRVTFSDSSRTFNAGNSATETNKFKIETTCDGSGTDIKKFDYSGLGETWSTPRIFRVPNPSSDNINNDRYVAVMGGGMGSGVMCTGSGVYVVDLEGGADESDNSELEHEAGKLYTEGPINILDSDPSYVKMGSSISGTFDRGSPIVNSIPASPVVITADKTDANWRGAMVYVNDLEGKITKLNFTSEGTLFEQKTIMNLRADNDNARLSYFEMDAAIGTTTKNLWLFGGTGDFNRISDTINEEGLATMDNIVYGVKDLDFPDFGPNAGLKYNSATFIEDAISALATSPTIDGAGSDLCVDTSPDDEFDPSASPTCQVEMDKIAWRYHLGTVEEPPVILSLTANKFRKTSASPTVHRGRVFFPIYEPNTDNACNLGTAYVCAYNDECGYLDSQGIDPDGTVPAGECYNAGAGILSKLVIFGSSMFANLAGPTDDDKTLIKILSSDLEYRSFKRSWRENF